jgi:hypothetical protein
MWKNRQSAELNEERTRELQLYCKDPAKFPQGCVKSQVLAFGDSFESAWDIVFNLLGWEKSKFPEKGGG